MVELFIEVKTLSL